MTPETPQTPYGLFTFFLSAEHLKGKSHTVKIKTVEITEVWDPRIKSKKPAVVLHFEKAQRVLRLNKTQLEQVMEITGTDQFNGWPGWEVTLTPAKSSNGKDTITITGHPVEQEPPKE